ncbi:hypothetical protein [Nocardia thailandica]|uniref:hypothetical protein n=1 Tax=Nocardia thailandica TaxID=257275 RepID=UPI00030B246C|nr:hypothetical protein [Nocardia thailandica]
MASARSRSTVGAALCALASGLLFLSPATASAEAGGGGGGVDYGGGCLLAPEDRGVTIDSLRFRCSAGQLGQVFSGAGRGAVPNGVTNGWVARPPELVGPAPALWIGKVFRTGPGGGTLTNRVTGAGVEAFPANVYAGPSILDGGDTWVLDYAPSPTPQVYDEIREVTPGVWLGYSWWRGAPNVLLATFVLAPA